MTADLNEKSAELFESEGFSQETSKEDSLKILKLKIRISALETVAKVHSETMAAMSSNIMKLADAVSDRNSRISNLIKAINFLDKKINALAITLTKNLDLDPDELQQELENIKRDSGDVKKEIESLIIDTNKYKGQDDKET